MDKQGTLGIDIGRVILEGDGADTSFLGSKLEDALRTPPTTGAFETIAELVHCFEGRVWLVSKCGPSVQKKTRAWLAHHRFSERTGVPEGNLRFCLERSQKALHCREIGATHFIDDRLDVLEHLRGLVPNLYLFGPQFQEPPEWVTPAPNWERIRSLLAKPETRETSEALRS